MGTVRQMTTTIDAEIRPVTAGLRLWWPQSGAAVGVFLLLGAGVMLLASVAFVRAYMLTAGCSLDCSEALPTGAVVAGALGLVLVLLPFAGVRFYQGRLPASARVRLGAVVLLAAVVGGYGCHVFGFPWFPF
jgi:hypothetical protein